MEASMHNSIHFNGSVHRVGENLRASFHGSSIHIHAIQNYFHVETSIDFHGRVHILPKGVNFTRKTPWKLDLLPLKNNFQASWWKLQRKKTQISDHLGDSTHKVYTLAPRRSHQGFIGHSGPIQTRVMKSYTSTTNSAKFDLRSSLLPLQVINLNERNNTCILSK